jgi:hypothetical protein
LRTGFDFYNFELAREFLRAQLLTHGEVVDVGEWQSIRGDIPQARTLELQDVHFSISIAEDVRSLQHQVRPNLPWAEDHFQERVSRRPLNPGEEYKNWPWYRGNVEQHQTVELQKFSHTYMERFWPKWANHNRTMRGIRYEYGDLQDVVSLLAKSPHTRQAYLPVWFPEDTGAVHGERVPCTLGYHFLLRGGCLNVYYFIRSCDFYRHFADDVYLACRLGQWVLYELTHPTVAQQATEFNEKAEVESYSWDKWQKVKMGKLIMQIDSLHVFEAERSRLERDAPYN